MEDQESFKIGAEITIVMDTQAHPSDKEKSYIKTEAVLLWEL